MNLSERLIIELAKKAEAWDVSGDELMLFSKNRIINFARLLEEVIKNDEEHSTHSS